MGDLCLIPGLGRSSGGGHGSPFQYSCLENLHGPRSLVGYSLVYSPWGHRVGHNWMTEDTLPAEGLGCIPTHQCTSPGPRTPKALQPETQGPESVHSRPTPEWGHARPHSQLCQELVSPTCKPVLVTKQWITEPSTSMPTTAWALPRPHLQSLGSLKTVISCLSLTHQCLTASVQLRIWQPTGLEASPLYQTTHSSQEPKQKDVHSPNKEQPSSKYLW